jgi:hypothetical protein
MKQIEGLLFLLPLFMTACGGFEPEKLDHENYAEGSRQIHLDFDLMGQQIEACREIGVSVRLYFTVGWSGIEVLILTSGGVLEEDLSRIRSFVDGGGKVISMGRGIFVDGAPVIDIGASYLGTANHDIDYTVVGEEVSEEIVASPFLNYTAAPTRRSSARAMSSFWPMTWTCPAWEGSTCSNRSTRTAMSCTFCTPHPFSGDR